MRCRACNAMMSYQRNKRGMVEDLCHRCRGVVYRSLTGYDWDEASASPEPVSSLETGIDPDQEEEDYMDRNHDDYSEVHDERD